MPDARHDNAAVCPLRILIMDDEIAICTAISRVLRRRGFHCSVAASGDEALSLIESAALTGSPYDLAIFDIKVPEGMGGAEAMHELRRRGSSLPLISMSGYTRQECLPKEEDSNGFVAHLEKPFSSEFLLKEIHRHCGSNRQQ